MYLITFIIIAISIATWYFTHQRNVYLNAPPKTCPTGYRKQGNTCVPNVTLIQNGLKFLTKNPNVPQDKIPKAYQPLVQSGYLTDRYGKWTSNYTPGGQPAAYNNTGCPNGQTKNSSGKCIPIGQPVATSGSGGCQPGYYKNKDGKCVKAPSATGGTGSTGGTGGGKCPDGQIKNKDGKCVKAPPATGGTGSTGGTGGGKCPDGQIKNKDGKCVKVPPATGGTGSTGGGGDCPSGQIKNKDGKCVKAPPATGGTGSTGGGCPSGQIKNKEGKCVKVSPATGGTGSTGGGSGGSIPAPIAQGGLLNWGWSGLDSGDKQTHNKTKPRGEQMVLVDSIDPQSRVDQAKKLAGEQGLVLGYLSAGSIEDWRYEELKKQGYKGPPPDMAGTQRGGSMKDWSGETWVDANKWEKMMPYMKGQMEFMKSRGINGIEVDNMSIDAGCNNKACRDKNLAYAQALVKTAKEMGMTIFMKNGSNFGDVDKNYMPKLAGMFDGFITEQANQYSGDNQMYKPYADSGKPWYNFEYRQKDKTCRTIAGQTQTYYQTNNGWEQCPS